MAFPHIAGSFIAYKSALRSSMLSYVVSASLQSIPRLWPPSMFRPYSALRLQPLQTLLGACGKDHIVVARRHLHLTASRVRPSWPINSRASLARNGDVLSVKRLSEYSAQIVPHLSPVERVREYLRWSTCIQSVVCQSHLESNASSGGVVVKDF
jgi:hypothetical protein